MVVFDKQLYLLIFQRIECHYTRYQRAAFTSKFDFD